MTPAERSALVAETRAATWMEMRPEIRKQAFREAVDFLRHRFPDTTLETATNELAHCYLASTPAPPVAEPQAKLCKYCSWWGDERAGKRCRKCFRLKMTAAESTDGTSAKCERCGGKPRGVPAPGGGWTTCPTCHPPSTPVAEPQVQQGACPTCGLWSGSNAANCGDVFHPNTEAASPVCGHGFYDNHAMFRCGLSRGHAGPCGPAGKP